MGPLRPLGRALRPTALSLALVLGFALAPSVHAVTIYDEATGGDLGGNQGSPQVLGSLQEGLNTFLGFDSKATDGPGGQGDTFAIALVSGQVLTAVDFTVSNYTGTDSYVVTFFRAATASPPFSFAVFRRFGPLSGDQTLHFNIPSGLTVETLGFSVQLATANDPTTGFNWRWDVQAASPVPEAGTAALMLAGLAGLGMRQLSRHRRSGAAG